MKNHSLNESLNSSIQSVITKPQNLSLKYSFQNYPKPKKLLDKPEPPNPNNPDNKEFHFEISLNNAVSFNLSEINPDSNKIFPRKSENKNIFSSDFYEQS